MRTANAVAETTTSIAGTLGDGAVTMTAIANTPRISTALGTGAVLVRYSIEKKSTGAFESGVGSAASNVLTRSKPKVTWDGTTWVDTGTVAAIQFGSTPTSGDVIIRLVPLAESQAPVVPGRNMTVAGDTNWRDYPISQHWNNWSNNGSGITLTADREYYVLYRADVAGRLTGVQFEVTGGIASSNMKLALYSMGTDGLPANKIVDFVTTATVTNTIKTDTATGSWTPSTGVTLNADWYLIGIIASHAIAIRGLTSNFSYSQPTPLGRGASYGWAACVYIAGSYATGLPAIANVTGGSLTNGANGDNCLWLGLKIQP